MYVACQVNLTTSAILPSSLAQPQAHAHSMMLEKLK